MVHIKLVCHLGREGRRTGFWNLLLSETRDSLQGEKSVKGMQNAQGDGTDTFLLPIREHNLFSSFLVQSATSASVM